MATVVPFTSLNQTTLAQADSNGQSAIAQLTALKAGSFRELIDAGFYYDTAGRNLNFYKQMSNLTGGTATVAPAAYRAIRPGSITGYSWIADGTMAAGGVSITYVSKNGSLFAAGTASGVVSSYSDTFTKGGYPFNAGDYLQLFISWNNSTTGSALRISGVIEIETTP